MVEQIQIDNSVIPFMTPKFHFGQKVSVDNKTGYVIGAQREKYSWNYLVVESDPLNNNSDEVWCTESDLAPAE